MARCPFAKWLPISGPVGSYTAGPYRIVHHTTEGASASGAIQAFRANRSDPHFTVDATTIYQHIDTGLAARALRNLAGGVETNRLSAVQIEVVGTAGHPKARPVLENVARLCRWLEHTHNIPQVWPNGPPKPAINGQDPGGHNRNPQNWVRLGGHYGHCHVPENIHWDPGYTPDEARFVLTYNPNPAGLADPEMEALRESFLETVDLEYDDIAIPDHADAGEGEPEDMLPAAAPAAAPDFYRTPEMAVLIAGLMFAGTFLLIRSVSRPVAA
ncbi:hypothetical protein DMC47_42950 [Nostoc sp. 3335mG]|nr:hypothetical protein DMC47_42950 [Nostoc sp. 3335mG]